MTDSTFHELRHSSSDQIWKKIYMFGAARQNRGRIPEGKRGMTLEILQTKKQINRSRRELRRRGLSASDSAIGQLLRMVRLNPTIAVGDNLKSWDVLRTIEILEQHIPKAGAILDIGAWSSEILTCLHRLGYTNLHGVDLNPKIRVAPHADSIRYEVADFMRTRYEPSSFEAITAISVIEHGFNGESLLREMERLLRPGGLFVASFDYWPKKLDTSGQKIFDMDWVIFSESDVRSFVASAADYQLTPMGPLSFAVTDRPIAWAGHHYTFGWLVLRKAA